MAEYEYQAPGRAELEQYPIALSIQAGLKVGVGALHRARESVSEKKQQGRVGQSELLGG